MELLELLISLLPLITFVLTPFLIFFAIRYLVKRRHRAAMERHQAAMAQLWLAYSQARSSGSAQKIVETGRALCQKAQPGGDLSEVAQRVYRDALQLLKKSPDLKPYALEIGRYSYGARRTGGQPTIYDEQAIQNDISTHSG